MGFGSGLGANLCSTSVKRTRDQPGTKISRGGNAPKRQRSMVEYRPPLCSRQWRTSEEQERRKPSLRLGRYCLLKPPGRFYAAQLLLLVFRTYLRQRLADPVPTGPAWSRIVGLIGWSRTHCFSVWIRYCWTTGSNKRRLLGHNLTPPGECKQYLIRVVVS